MGIKERIENINLFDGKEDLTVLHLSDFHIRYTARPLSNIENMISRSKPDLIVMTGDYFDIPKGALHFREFMIRVASKTKIIFIRGNHDYVYGRSIANLIVNLPNCHCVENDIFNYTSKKGYTYLITSWDNKIEIQKSNSTKNIVLIHNPEKIKESQLENIDLILAGHLHGGQLILHRTRNGFFFPGNILYKYCTDRIKIGGTDLIISKGLGDTLPLRINCPTEIVKLQIH